MKKVTLPTEMSSELAEEIGIHIGDGSLSIRPKSGHYNIMFAWASMKKNIWNMYVG